jgi:phosphate starvation-inducible PhoH-like protein
MTGRTSEPGSGTVAPAPARSRARPDSTEIILALEDNRLASRVFGLYDQNLAHIERRLGIAATANGNRIIIKGPPDSAERARRVLIGLQERVRRGEDIQPGDVDGILEEVALQGTLFHGSELPSFGFELVATRKKGAVRARNAAQDGYLRLLRRHELVFAAGPAGTGKTWLAVGHAVALMEQGEVDRLILSRPAVEAGERLGFLPGDMKDKVDPYLRPIYDALYDFMDARRVEQNLQSGVIEIAPLAFMRGRTLTRAAVLLDEAQNTTPMQMKMFLTRLGEGSRMIVTGDPTQIDLPPGQRSGLIDALALLTGVEGIGIATFGENDVVRHDLVRRIVQAYESASPRPAGDGRRERT